MTAFHKHQCFVTHLSLVEHHSHKSYHVVFQTLFSCHHTITSCATVLGPHLTPHHDQTHYLLDRKWIRSMVAGPIGLPLVKRIRKSGKEINSKTIQSIQWGLLYLGYILSKRLLATPLSMAKVSFLFPKLQCLIYVFIYLILKRICPGADSTRENRNLNDWFPT